MEDEDLASKPQIVGPQRVAVIIPAYNSRRTIGSTVRACRAIPSVDLIVVVDDGSTDDTGNLARAAGAAVVRHSVARGRASALETGVKVAAMRDRADWPDRLLLFLEADLGDSAIESAALVDAVASGVADCAIGIPPSEDGRRMDRISRAAAKGIQRTTGWAPLWPLSTERCVTREALNEVMPFAAGWGADVAMTIDLITLGFSVVEVPCAFHRVYPQDHGHEVYRPPQQWEVWLALLLRRLMTHRVPSADRMPLSEQGIGIPYKRLMPGSES